MGDRAQPSVSGALYGRRRLRERVPGGSPRPPPPSPPMNEDGHVSNSRRGLLAAGLAAAVVGSMGVVWTLNASAEETPEAPVPAVAAPADGAAPADVAAPAPPAAAAPL